MMETASLTGALAMAGTESFISGFKALGMACRTTKKVV
jgi:hypothetical protein